jgi:hypothetical protein
MFHNLLECFFVHPKAASKGFEPMHGVVLEIVVFKYPGSDHPVMVYVLPLPFK